MDRKEYDETSYSDQLEKRIYRGRPLSRNARPRNTSRTRELLVLMPVVLKFIKSFSFNERVLMKIYSDTQGDRNITAFAMNLKPKTVDTYLRRLAKKLHLLLETMATSHPAK